MNSLRVFSACGLTSFRALFGWINPWVFIPILVVYPIFQIMFFVYLGRSAGVGSDSFFLIGNTFVGAAVAGLFGMGQSIGGERRFQTLPALLASPANRLALFAGRAVPSIATGFLVAAVSFAAGAAILRISVSGREVAALVIALIAACFTCATLGLCIGALGLRGRSVGLFADTIAGGLLIVSGANVPLHRLPGAVQTLASFVPLTHGIKAARAVANGATLGSTSSFIGKEFAVGAVYLVAGLAMLIYFEHEGRRTGSLDRN